MPRMTDTDWQDDAYGRCVWSTDLPLDGYHRMLRFSVPIMQMRLTQTLHLYCEHGVIAP